MSIVYEFISIYLSVYQSGCTWLDHKGASDIVHCLTVHCAAITYPWLYTFTKNVDSCAKSTGNPAIGSRNLQE